MISREEDGGLGIPDADDGSYERQVEEGHTLLLLECEKTQWERGIEVLPKRVLQTFSINVLYLRRSGNEGDLLFCCPLSINIHQINLRGSCYSRETGFCVRLTYQEGEMENLVSC